MKLAQVTKQMTKLWIELFHLKFRSFNFISRTTHDPLSFFSSRKLHKFLKFTK